MCPTAFAAPGRRAPTSMSLGSTRPRRWAIPVMLATGLLLACFTAGDPAGAAPLPTGTDNGLIVSTPLIPELSRDCGFSVTLSDGNLLWIYCDSFYTSNTGVLHPVLSNTAAFAGPSSMTTMQDRIYNFYGENILNGDNTYWGGRSFITMPANPINFPCTGGIRKAWPRGAVNVRGAGPGGSDKVLIYYSRICDKTQTAGELSYVQNGTGLAEFDYTPGSFNPTVGPTGPIVATKIVNDNLFSYITPFGTGAMLSNDGAYIYAYRCSAYCFVSRVATANVGTTSAYTYWNGRSWGTQATKMSMTGDSLPLALFNVVWLPQIAKYVMTYTPCTQGCYVPWFDRIAVRTATQPWGPWSAPVNVAMPGCTSSYTATPCNAALSHLELSTSDFAVSFSRRNEGAPPPGRMHWGTIPLTLIH